MFHKHQDEIDLIYSKRFRKCLPTKRQYEKNKESVEFKEYRKEDFATVQKALTHTTKNVNMSYVSQYFMQVL